jgi:hypothetical protein
MSNDLRSGAPTKSVEARRSPVQPTDPDGAAGPTNALATNAPKTESALTASTSPAPASLSSALAAPIRRPAVTAGQQIMLKVPLAALVYDGMSFNGNIIVAGVVRPVSDQAVSVGSTLDWQTVGFPPLTQFTFEKLSRKKDYREIELRSASVWVKLRFDSHIDDVMRVFGTSGGWPTTP